VPDSERTRVLRYAYEQVLDATKHQDDKINRLLTAIAFLTGGALAVAGLNGAKFLTHPYYVGRYESPLALVAVGVFFVGVVATVLMLIGSLTTPLRLPSVPDPKRRTDPGPPRLPVTYASGDAKVSPIYFFEISKLSLGQWQTKWAKDLEAAVVSEEHDALVRETHNLAIRTEFKYTRTNEAVAVLSFALAALAAAAVLVLVAAAYPVGPIPLAAPLQASLSIVLGGYVWLQIRTSLRHRIQSVEELYWVYVQEKHGSAIRFWFPIAAAAVPVLLLSVTSSDWRWSLAIGVITLVPLGLFWRIRNDEREPAKSAKDDGPLIAAICLAVLYASVCWVSTVTEHAEVRLLASFATTIVVLIAAFVSSRGRTLKRLTDFQDSLGSAPADETAAPVLSSSDTTTDSRRPASI